MHFEKYFKQIFVLFIKKNNVTLFYYIYRCSGPMTLERKWEILFLISNKNGNRMKEQEIKKIARVLEKNWEVSFLEIQIMWF